MFTNGNFNGYPNENDGNDPCRDNYHYNHNSNHNNAHASSDRKRSMSQITAAHHDGLSVRCHDESATAPLPLSKSARSTYAPASSAAAPAKLMPTTAPNVTPTPSTVASTSTAATPPTTTNTSTTTTTDKGYKGLRHFSMMVCKKVEEKGTTTYSEVADELVQDVMEERRRGSASSGTPPNRSSTTTASSSTVASPSPEDKLDEKNIRRRVYDALNVLMAMDIIVKHKKEISWKGLPSSGDAHTMLQREIQFRERAVAKKRDALQELLVQHVCFRNLVQHNYQKSQQQTQSQKQSKQKAHAQASSRDNTIPLPFIVINTSSAAVIQCNMSRDLTDVQFDFSMPFEINDDNTILKGLGLYVSLLLYCFFGCLAFPEGACLFCFVDFRSSHTFIFQFLFLTCRTFQQKPFQSTSHSTNAPRLHVPVLSAPSVVGFHSFGRHQPRSRCPVRSYCTGQSFGGRQWWIT